MLSSFRVVLLALSALCLAGCGGEKVQPTRSLSLVKTEVVELQPWQTVIRLTGDVQARVSTELSFRVSGRVTERLVDVGAHVNAGDVLATIDPTEQQADLAGSQAAVAAAEAQVRVATANFERQKSLIDKGFTTRVAYDQAQEALRTAEGSLETAKAQLGNATDALSYTKLRASASGIITARNIEVGQVAQAAQSAYTLAEDGARDAVVDVYESIFLTPWEGSTAKLMLLSDPKVTALAKPREISPTVDPKSGAVRVKMSIINPPAAMTLGSVVAAEGRSKPVDKIVLPWSALTWDVNGPAVWVVDPQTRAVSLKSIAVQAYETNSVVVASGLAPGERVVIDGGKLLRPAQVVTYDGANA
ncbi:efflux RND transporter periplasmic adaptor subunit [Rhodopseudomonas sp. HC1]|uniref:efflux RND transporter periplasmic adaptor subunit n=1 Tax=Rhodopseudomonas infernalis TaxID=2897386 RepID=UPI001EE79F0B|nr:efflux RND transporter periplasmic adaptor subunit [Rhodopseudomonas infernalis]MCG6203080.1 efflux RND transporter periplasmic adaptor subunit [Rhodopseudomonas infernalis]